MKVLVLNKKTLIYVALVICLSLAVILSVTALVPKVTAVAAAGRKVPIYGVDRQDKVASLSFDAAWGKNIMGTNLKTLKTNKTFFLG
jgi:hypothetical protein